MDVLLVEDSQPTERLIRMVVESLGRSMSVARAGDEAIEILGKMRPRLVLLDMHLPRVGGLEVVRWIRNHERLTALPVIALTAHAMPGQPEAFLGAGCNDYMSKPIDTRQFASVIRKYLDHPERTTEASPEEGLRE